jgi:dGTP triphosphohydrolase
MKIIKKLLGLDKLEASIAKAESDLAEANKKLEEAEKASTLALEQEELAKLTPKERAIRKKEPWVGVLNTHVNKDNIRNGFFELDWNEYFVLQLKQEGYGEDGDKDEEIVDRWFRELCANVVVDGDYGGPINTGVIDIQSVKKNNQ